MADKENLENYLSKGAIKAKEEMERSMKEHLENYVSFAEVVRALKDGMEENRCVIPLKVAKDILHNYESVQAMFDLNEEIGKRRG